MFINIEFQLRAQLQDFSILLIIFWLLTKFWISYSEKPYCIHDVILFSMHQRVNFLTAILHKFYRLSFVEQYSTSW